MLEGLILEHISLAKEIILPKIFIEGRDSKSTVYAFDKTLELPFFDLDNV
jgi:hypothetical protein